MSSASAGLGPETRVALGVLSTAGGFETGRASAAKSALQRAAVRTAARVAGSGHGVALRFVVSLRNGRNGEPPPERVVREAASHGDLVFLNMTERFYLCAWKYHLWFRHAARAFPAAAWFAVADSDAFVQLAHLGEDLGAVGRLVASGDATRHVLWGLIMWKAYYNKVAEEPAREFSGWLPRDERALGMRRRLERCASLLANRSDAPPRPEWLLPGKGPDAPYDAWASAVLERSRPCRGLERATRRALGRMHAGPPFPFANGPLFALSRPLAELLATGPLVPRWRRRIEATQPVRRYHEHGGRVPYSLRGQACYPASFDAYSGAWVAEAAAAHRLTVTLVNTPFMVQHHPWFATRHGAFSNASIVLHELKNPASPGWQFAAGRGGGPFVPLPRVCDTCEALRWSTDPGSPYARWRCCGRKYRGPGRGSRSK